MSKTVIDQGLINHFALVLDASGSIAQRKLEGAVVKVADQQIEYLAQLSKDSDQETRVSIYDFSDYNYIRCLIFDKDVLRLPSIKSHYHARGNTALRDATKLAIEDLKHTSQKYGDHAFLLYVVTDGEENNSRTSATSLRSKINALPENWTVAAFVPNTVGQRQCEDAGFPRENIAIWTTSGEGMKEVARQVQTTTANFFKARATGVRGTRNLFHVGAVDTKNLGKLKPLHAGQYRLYKIESSDVDQVKRNVPIARFVEARTKRGYQLGEAYYELVKPETIQANKQVVLLHRKSRQVYSGPETRKLVNLPDYDVRVAPDYNPDFAIYPQSTSTNRNLPEGTSLIVLSPQV